MSDKMDKGARFYRCDFQVHSPRDCNWEGDRPRTEDDRSAYAQAFIAACRQKGLDAVAITDHHDVCFFSYVKAAAEAEKDGNGVPVPEHRRIVVFPGMELTLAVPCQALVIFDADIPIECLPHLYTVLGVSQNDHAEPTHVQATRLDIDSLDRLAEMFDRIEYLRGRYIILPNVSEGGNSTILRSGFAAVYRAMPCVGGYLDGPVSQLGLGNRGILNGTNKEYGQKKLGLFQTSDSRSAGFENLGLHSTWVKWATPTAEAIRQACLASETRISHEPPVLPSIVITRLEVSNSRFLGPIDIYFNPQYSCLIGGRGTGKSTILEYLRWALCDQPPTYSDEDEAVAYQEKRASLIDKTLVPFEGVVTVSFLLDSVPHVVRRSPQTKEVSLKIGSEDFKVCTEADVRDLLPLQAYSQKQLSAVGIRTDELVRFIRTSIKADLDRLGSEIDAHRTHVKSVFNSLMHKRKLQRELDRDQLELASLTLRVEALRQELKGVSDADRQVLAQHDKFLQEEQFVEKLDRDLGTAREMASDFRKSLAELPSKIVEDRALPNYALIEQIRSALAASVAAAAGQVEAVIETLAATSPGIGAYLTLLEAWKAAFATHNEHYKRAKQDASSHQSQITQIDEAEATIKLLRTEVAKTQEAIDQFGPIDHGFREGRLVWVGLQKTRADMMQAKCAELTSLSEQRIRAHIKRGAGVDKIKGRLLSLLVGTKIRTKKVDDLCETVSKAADPLATWSEVVAELEKLVDYSGGEAAEPKVRDTPLLTNAGFADNDLDRLAPKLTPEEWVELSLTELEDIPVFEYRQTIGQYIQFSDASAGQQATALLRVLLNQTGPPLVIDQPEEDLDNQVILEIVQQIWKAKNGRQIIFSSHNPNIVVNGDADLVACCDYRTAGDHSGGRIKCCGAIDVDEIKKEITVVMEGGKDAFRLRKDKYGF
jgi:chromosome segregation protein